MPSRYQTLGKQFMVQDHLTLGAIAALEGHRPQRVRNAHICPELYTYIYLSSQCQDRYLVFAADYAAGRSRMTGVHRRSS